MSKKKAAVIVTISIYPHTPDARETIEVAHAGKDEAGILAALIVEKYNAMKKRRTKPESVIVGVHYDEAGNAVDTVGNKLKRKRRASTKGGAPAS